MANLLTDKDRQWRKRPNGASPVFDPGLSSLGTDDEAGGAPAPPAGGGEAEGATPLPVTPDASRSVFRHARPIVLAVVGIVAVLLIVGGLMTVWS